MDCELNSFWETEDLKCTNELHLLINGSLFEQLS